MAFSIAVFKTRALTATLFAIIMLVGVLWNRWSFVALFTIIHFGCWYEFIKLLKKVFSRKYVLYLPAGLLYITVPVLMMLDFAFPNLDHSLADKGFEDAFEHPVLVPCIIIFSVWINDTMAYIVGSFIGKTPFSKISPKKTWEGTIGGVLLCVLVTGYLVAPFVSGSLVSTITYPIRDIDWFIIAGICAVFGTAGDLFESKLKRMAGVKDSGRFMPGHGGFLDRFDSILVATPFVWLYIYVFMK